MTRKELNHMLIQLGKLELHLKEDLLINNGLIHHTLRENYGVSEMDIEIGFDRIREIAQAVAMYYQEEEEE